MNFKVQMDDLTARQKIISENTKRFEGLVHEFEPQINDAIIEKWAEICPGYLLSRLRRKSYVSDWDESYDLLINYERSDWKPDFIEYSLERFTDKDRFEYFPCDNGKWKYSIWNNHDPITIYTDRIPDSNLSIQDVDEMFSRISEELGINLVLEKMHFPMPEEIEEIYDQDDIYLKYPNAEILFRCMIPLDYKCKFIIVIRDGDKKRFWYSNCSYKITEEYKEPFDKSAQLRLNKMIKFLNGTGKNEEAKRLQEIANSSLDRSGG